MTNVENAEQELELAKLSEEYDAANEAVREDPSDANLDRKNDLAQKVVAVRQQLRQRREAEAQDLPEGDGVAQPRPVEGSTEVSS
jgi:hypothetical protein